MMYMLRTDKVSRDPGEYLSATGEWGTTESCELNVELLRGRGFPTEGALPFQAQPLRTHEKAGAQWAKEMPTEY